MDWKAFVFGDKGKEYEHLRSVANQRFWYDPTLADEAFSFAFDVLAEGNWQRLSRFSGRSSPRTFLVSAFMNAVEDFVRKRYGRRRPPKWIERLGGIWIDVYTWLCLDRLDARAVIERLQSKPLAPDAPLPAEIVRAVRAALPRCGESTGPTRLDSGDDDPDFDPFEFMVDTTAADPCCGEDDSVEAAMLAISSLLGLVQYPGNRLDLDSLAALTLTDEDLVLLRLVYVEEESVAACSRALGKPEHQVRAQLRRLLDRIGGALSAAGFDPSELQK